MKISRHRGRIIAGMAMLIVVLVVVIGVGLNYHKTDGVNKNCIADPRVGGAMAAAPGQLMLSFKSGVDGEQTLQLFARYGLTILINRSSDLDYFVVAVPQSVDQFALEDTLKADPLIESATQNYCIYPL